MSMEAELGDAARFAAQTVVGWCAHHEVPVEVARLAFAMALLDSCRTNEDREQFLNDVKKMFAAQTEALLRMSRKATKM